MRVGLLVGVLMTASLSSACASVKPEARAALTGTLPELRQEIARAEAGGPLPEKRLRALARAIAEREITSASGSEGAATIASFRPCASALQEPLSERAERGDEPAAVATLLLFEAGKRDAEDLVSRYSEADSGAFRALAARAALARQHAELRRRYFTDPDERVRRGAFEAALRAPLASQLPDLLEAARLDPGPGNRARAAQAVGRIGGEKAVLGLMDLFSAGDEQEQLAILGGWADPRSFGHGGERELARALNRPGLVAVSAASLLLQSRDSRAAALAVLSRAIAGGSDDERRLALMAAPIEHAQIKLALEQASKSPSPAITPLVLARLTELPGAAAKARADLEKLAEDKGDVGLEAAFALAQLGSMRATSRIEQELSSKLAWRRLRAATALEKLGKRRRLAQRLADEDPLLRASLACRLTGEP
jgi:HEAT repeat protein